MSSPALALRNGRPRNRACPPGSRRDVLSRHKTHEPAAPAMPNLMPKDERLASPPERDGARCLRATDHRMGRPKGVDADPPVQAPPCSARDGNALHNIAIHLRETRPRGPRRPQTTPVYGWWRWSRPFLLLFRRPEASRPPGGHLPCGALGSPAILVTKEDAHA
jgi:hypothetical protein